MAAVGEIPIPFEQALSSWTVLSPTGLWTVFTSSSMGPQTTAPDPDWHAVRTADSIASISCLSNHQRWKSRLTSSYTNVWDTFPTHMCPNLAWGVEIFSTKTVVLILMPGLRIYPWRLVNNVSVFTWIWRSLHPPRGTRRLPGPSRWFAPRQRSTGTAGSSGSPCDAERKTTGSESDRGHSWSPETKENARIN